MRSIVVRALEPEGPAAEIAAQAGRAGGAAWRVDRRGSSDAPADTTLLLGASRRATPSVRFVAHSRGGAASVALAESLLASFRAAGWPAHRVELAPLDELDLRVPAAVLVELGLAGEVDALGSAAEALVRGTEAFLRGERLPATDDDSYAVEDDAEPSCQDDSVEEEPLDESAFDAADDDLSALLQYLALPADEFAQHESRYFESLSRHLRRHGTIGAGDTLGPETFRAAVRRFQQSNGLGADGIPGQDTLWKLQVDEASSHPVSVRRVDADAVAGSDGYDRFMLRAEVVEPYQALREAVRAKGGVITSAGSLRGLEANVSAGRSSTSMHYSGLALDLATDTGMRDPSRDAYLVERDGSRWRVFARAEAGDVRSVQAVIWRHGAVALQPTTARVVDLTEMAVSFGFRPIGPRSSFPANYLSAEWWHFQWERALVPGISQFGVELVRLHGLERSAASPPWEHRLRIFRRGKEGWR